MRAVALIVVLGLVAFASGIKIFNQNEALTLACCGSNSYDTTTQFCCIDNIFRNDDSDTNLCCGRNRLGNDKQCCSALDGVVSVNDKQISSSQTCCGTTGYDPSNQLCCAPNRVLNNKDGNLQCCGNDRTYDPSRDLCCSTVRIRDRGNCEDAEVDVNFNVVSNGANDGKQCCGSSAFNPSTQLCCGGTDDARVVSNGNDNNLQCCGSSSYDPSRQTCCQVESSQDFTVDGQTVTVTFTRGNVAGNANLQCCDDGSLNAFDPATQICCAGNVQRQNSDNSLACCGSRTFNTLTQTCCSREVAKFKRVKGCCGSCDTFVAVTETEFNIGSPANAQCCDNRPYDDTKNICCKDNIIRQNDDNSLQCCGSDAYNTNRDICCTDESQEHGRVFRDRLNDDVTYDCCLNTDASECNVKYNFDIFDTAKKSCPCGKVIDQRDDLSLNNNNPNVQAGCCGTTQIDVNSKTCCAKAIHDVDPAIGFKCCNDDGKTLYNPGYQVCCGGKSAGCSVPCGAKKTRDVEETESSEEVEAKDEDKKKKKKSDNNRSKVQCGDSCCGKEGYFAAYQKCCDGKILDFNSAAAGSSPMTCCGDEIYNSNFRNCCIDTRIKSIGRCGIKGSVDHAIFDADTQICCGSGVVTVA